MGLSLTTKKEKPNDIADERGDPNSELKIDPNMKPHNTTRHNQRLKIVRNTSPKVFKRSVTPENEHIDDIPNDIQTENPPQMPINKCIQRTRVFKRSNSKTKENSRLILDECNEQNEVNGKNPRTTETDTQEADRNKLCVMETNRQDIDTIEHCITENNTGKTANNKSYRMETDGQDITTNEPCIKKTNEEKIDIDKSLYKSASNGQETDTLNYSVKKSNIQETDRKNTIFNKTNRGKIYRNKRCETNFKEADSNNAYVKEDNIQEIDNNNTFIMEDNIKETNGKNTFVTEMNKQETYTNKPYTTAANVREIEKNTSITEADVQEKDKYASVTEPNKQETYNNNIYITEVDVQETDKKKYSVTEMHKQETYNNNTYITETNIQETDEKDTGVMETNKQETYKTNTCITETNIEETNEENTSVTEIITQETYENRSCATETNRDELDSRFLIHRNLMPNRWMFTENTRTCTIFNINGERFVEKVDYGDEVVEFEVITDTESDSDNEDTEYTTFLTMKNTRHGIVLNSTIILSEYQWNTIINSNGMHWCCVCSLPVSPLEHIKTYIHIKNLDQCKPIKKFDISITRLINEQYHCGVCNELFPMYDEYEHYNSESHKQNLDHAIETKKSLIDDLNVHSNTAYSKTKHDAFGYQDSFDRYDFEGCVDSVGVTKAKCSNEGNIGERNGSAGDVNGDNGNSVDNGNGDNGNSVDNGNGDNGIEARLPVSGVSYASMAKKSTTIIPKPVSVKVKGRQYKIDFYSWNMILSLKSKFYCMACKEHVANNGSTLNSHCTSDRHVSKLKSCDVVETCEEFLVRKVDDKFCHCIHCNNLLLHNDVTNHIEKQHTKTNQNQTNTTNNTASSVAKELPSNANGNDHNGNVDNGNDKMANRTNTPEENINNDINNDARTDIRVTDNEIIVQLFGFNIKIPVLSYNVIFVATSGYYCGVCRMAIARNQITEHLIDYRHIYMLKMFPFLIEFGVNLFRLVPEGMHCTICNNLIPLKNWNLTNHIQDRMHVTLLNKALNININMKIAIKSNALNYSNPIGNNQSNISKLHQSDLNQCDENITNDRARDNKDALNSNQSNTIDVNQPDLNDLNNWYENDSDSSDVDDFEEEENVILVIKNYNIPVSITAFNSLVGMGDGTRFCFVCSNNVLDVGSHVKGFEHLKNMNEYKYLDEYSKHLIRQNSNGYHCTICNVLIFKKHLKNHLNWPVHVESDSFKIKQSDVILRRHIVETAKEAPYLYKEPKINILWHFEFQNDKVTAKSARTTLTIVIKGKAFKVSWDAWNGITGNKNGRRCIICQINFDSCDLLKHVAMAAHLEKLDRNFEMQYLPALMRRVNDNTLHCLVCNLELLNPKKTRQSHIRGKRHVKNQENLQILDVKSVDEHEDVFILR